MSRSRRLALLVVSVWIALGLAACGPGEEGRASSDEPEAGATIEFKYDDAIEAAERTLIEETIAESRRFYAEQLGRDLQSDIIVVVTAEGGDFLLGLSFGKRVWIFTGSPDWPAGDDEEAVLLKRHVVAHELFHSIQWDLQNTDDAVPGGSPRWILEGSAEYAASRFMHATYGNDRAVLDAFGLGRLPRLDSDQMLSYTKATAAIDELIGDKPFSLLGGYFSATARRDWRDAFDATFGEDPDSFVTRFEAAHR